MLIARRCHGGAARCYRDLGWSGADMRQSISSIGLMPNVVESVQALDVR